MKLDVKANIKNNARVRWIAGALLVTGAAALHSGAQKSHNAGIATAASDERRRVVNDVEPFCRALVPDHDTLRFQVSPINIYSTEGASSAYWMVECSNAASQEIVHAVWNADTKKMFSMSLLAAPRSDRALPAGKAQADASARRWLTHLNMASQFEAVSSPAKTALIGGIWRVDLRLSGGRAIVWINARSGALEHIMVREGVSVYAREARHPAPNLALGILPLRAARLSAAIVPQRAVPILPPAFIPDA